MNFMLLNQIFMLAFGLMAAHFIGIGDYGYGTISLVMFMVNFADYVIQGVRGE